VSADGTGFKRTRPAQATARLSRGSQSALKWGDAPIQRQTLRYAAGHFTSSTQRMPNPPARFDASFIANQQRKLIAARDALSSSIARDGDEDQLLELAAHAQANESEDRAQDASVSDNNRMLVDVLTERRTSIERALAKIDEGTYGYSDLSGEPIPLDRLEAYPEALRTVGEA